MRGSAARLQNVSVLFVGRGLAPARWFGDEETVSTPASFWSGAKRSGVEPPEEKRPVVSVNLVFVVGAMYAELFCALTRRYGGDLCSTETISYPLLRLALLVSSQISAFCMFTGHLRRGAPLCAPAMRLTAK